MNSVVKSCNCGARHTQAEFNALESPPSGGYQVINSQAYALRRCKCGALLALPVSLTQTTMERVRSRSVSYHSLHAVRVALIALKI